MLGLELELRLSSFGGNSLYPPKFLPNKALGVGVWFSDRALTQHARGLGFILETPPTIYTDFLEVQKLSVQCNQSWSDLIS